MLFSYSLQCLLSNGLFLSSRSAQLICLSHIPDSIPSHLFLILSCPWNMLVSCMQKLTIQRSRSFFWKKKKQQKTQAHEFSQWQWQMIYTGRHSSWTLNAESLYSCKIGVTSKAIIWPVFCSFKLKKLCCLQHFKNKSITFPLTTYAIKGNLQVAFLAPIILESTSKVTVFSKQSSDSVK